MPRAWTHEHDLPKPDLAIAGLALYQRDCREILPRLRPRSVHAIVSDPPYGTTNVATDIACTDAGWFDLAARCTDEWSCIVLFACGQFTARLLAEQRRQYRYKWVWHRVGTATGHLDVRHRPMRAHEDILVFGRRGRFARYFSVRRPAKLAIVRHRGQTQVGTVYGKTSGLVGEYRSRMRHPTDVLQIRPDPSRTRLTPFQKPLPLVEFLVRSYSRKGQLVADPFLGSGTTAVACLRTERRFVGCEIDRDLFRKACKRIEAAAAES